MIDSAELLRWYEQAQRDLPWRRADVTPWQILVSEFMLQQTPVARVEPIWLDWVARWPTPSATAAAGAADVLRAWGRLGYPRRAKRLHECATVIAEHFEDVVPSDVETLLTLPGIGAYTARAVACFAYRQRVPVVDTNVRRVVARAVHGTAEAAASSSPRDLTDVDALLPNDVDVPAVFGRVDGARRDGLHGTGATVRPVPVERVHMAIAWLPGSCRSCPPRAALRRHGSSGPGPPARCVARQRLSRHPCRTRYRMVDRHRTTGPRAGLATGRRFGRANCRRPVCTRRGGRLI